jgi:DNA-binding transcriptional LysR family regulator
MVRLLEDREGVRLLDRTKRGGVSLTPAGKRFYESCEKIFGEVELLKAAARSEKGECAGPLALGVSDNLACYVFPRLLERFLREHPRVSLKLFSGTSEAVKSELMGAGCELGAFYTPVREPGFEAEQVATVQFELVVSPKSWARPGAGEAGAQGSSRMPAQPRLADLAGLPYIGSRASDYARPYPALVMLRSIGADPGAGSVLEANHQETQKRLALQGYGYTLVPRFMVREELASGALKAVRVPPGREAADALASPLSSPLYLVRRKCRTLSRPAELFEKHLRKSIAALV